MRKYFPYLIVGWTVITGCTLLINLYILQRNSDMLAQTKSEALFNLLVTSRQWNANHGLVYVPVTKTMKPNPYLVHGRRDIVSNFGDSLTLINPAFMTRQIAELSEKNGTTGFHITSLNPIRPANKADTWETKALRSFTSAGDKYFEKIKARDSVIFRYMAPLVVGQACLSCHASQGYKLGDIRGGISINTTYHQDDLAQVKASVNKIIIIYTVVFLIGLLLILYFRSKAIKHRSDIETCNKELRESNAAKDKFFSVIAHDLRTPAANLKFLTETLKDNYADLSADDQKNYINMLYESAKTYNNLLNDLLDLSRLRTGKIQCRYEQLNIRDLANEVLDQTKLQAQQKQITQVNQTEKCFVIADKSMIATVLRNIVVNAIKFTHPGGQITICASYTDQDVVISVADTGIGIRKEVANQIFEANYNMSTTGTANEPGTGLGLMICKEFVEYNKGKIWVESVVGSGTTFFFTLPADKQK